MTKVAFLPLALVLVGCAVERDDSDGSESKLISNVYAALGDSYASGTGTREYFDSGCKRSHHAYASQLASARGYELDFVACSGARIPDVRANQLGALSADTGLVTISIGGNDAGFADVITQCALPWPTTCWGDIDNSQAFITNQLPGQLNSLYSEIRGRAPNARVIVVGYPRLFNGEQCNFGARISPGEQAELNATADLLSDTISGVASAHGFTYLDSRGAFTNHAVCDDVEWVNGLSNPIVESYHPNQRGHDAFTDLLSSRL